MKWILLIIIMLVIPMPTNANSPSVEISGNYFMVRVWSPDLFDESTLRWKDIDKQRGIGSLIGRPKDSNGTRIQSLRFLRSKWNRDRALRWSRSHWRELTRPLP